MYILNHVSFSQILKILLLLLFLKNLKQTHALKTISILRTLYKQVLSYYYMATINPLFKKYSLLFFLYS